VNRSTLVCQGCDATLPPLREAPLAFRCPGADASPGVDHVLARKLSQSLPFSPADDEHPLLRFRELDHVYLSARDAGLSDDAFVSIVRRLDEAIARADGRGFRVTPFSREASLERSLGFSGQGTLYVKDETRNVSGSHKGRHLLAPLVHLEIVRELGLSSNVPELVIASCGNAALAAAVLARAAEKPLRVFVPEDADPPVVARIRALGADVEVCPRAEGVRGDPTYHRFLEAVRAGAIPFSCQGPDQALAVQGGKTIAWEMIWSESPAFDRVFVQVGGGALASAVFSAFEEATSLGRLSSLPRAHAVQTRGCFPLARAYDRLVDEITRRRALTLPGDPDARALALRDALGEGGIDEAVRDAAQRRADFMQPWEEPPHSIAHGILDDETYDWLAVVRAMLRSAGYPIVVDDDDIRSTLDLARRDTGVDVCPTGVSSFAGLAALARQKPAILGERMAVLFTGARRHD